MEPHHCQAIQSARQSRCDKKADPEEFERITCGVVTGRLAVPQDEKIMVAFTKFVNGLVPHALLFGILQFQSVVSVVQKYRRDLSTRRMA
jgi:hypothetical protein